MASGWLSPLKSEWLALILRYEMRGITVSSLCIPKSFITQVIKVISQGPCPPSPAMRRLVESFIPPIHSFSATPGYVEQTLSLCSCGFQSPRDIYSGNEAIQVTFQAWVGSSIWRWEGLLVLTPTWGFPGTLPVPTQTHVSSPRVMRAGQAPSPVPVFARMFQVFWDEWVLCASCRAPNLGVSFLGTYCFTSKARCGIERSKV